MVVECCAGWVVGKSEHGQRREGGRKKGGWFRVFLSRRIYM